jgi:hypothetical protein
MPVYTFLHNLLNVFVLIENKMGLQNQKILESGFIRFRITGNLVFVHYLKFYMLENTTFWKLDLFTSSGEGKVIPTMLGPLEKVNLNYWTSHAL